MPFLDAALAFSMTMLVVATAVTQIVRLILKFARSRASVLQDMLKEYFRDEFQPVLDREVDRLRSTITPIVANKLNTAAAAFNQQPFVKDAENKKLVAISTEELIEYIKRTSLGQDLLTQLGDKADAVFAELGSRYEVVGNRFTASFRKNSRLYASLVAVVLALAVNIDSLFIADSYIKSESLRRDVIAQGDDFVQDYESLLATLETDGEDTPVTKAMLQEAVGDTRDQLDVLNSVGFPIGWRYFPHSALREDGNAAEFERRNSFGGWFMWVLGILLTGILAGLGAPFWYDAVTGISRAAHRARGGKKPS